MNYQELLKSDFTKDLVNEIAITDLSGCSNEEIYYLKSFSDKLKRVADRLTLEDELVGYTYYNLGVLTPKINSETIKRKIKI